MQITSTSTAFDEPKGDVQVPSAHYSNGTSSSKKITCKTKFTHNTAATKIQTAYRAHLVTILLYIIGQFQNICHVSQSES